MPSLNLVHPIIENGNTYPHVAVQMIVNPRLEGGGYINSAVFNFTAFRILPNGTVDALVDDPHAGAPRIPSLFVGDVTARAQQDPALAQALGTILYGIQGYLTAKGI